MEKALLLPTRQLKVTGTVQGVGFRPYVYHLANQLNLTGHVSNASSGVEIMIQGPDHLLDLFTELLGENLPHIARISSIQVQRSNMARQTDGFSIIQSSFTDNERTEISPDLATCPACLQDMKNQPHRINYPFINCTQCGPRFSITKSMPYDRPNTTMSAFIMCPTCESEYNNPEDRRFHAQPIACHKCGPVYTLTTRMGETSDIQKILHILGQSINNGQIAAIKGLGGFFLMCDANNELAITELRRRKKRYRKPFAVMFKDVTAIKKYAELNDIEERKIRSIERPIVLLKDKKILPPSVSSGLQNVGAILPYMPIHHFMFEHFYSDAVIFTSGNISDEPILTDNIKAKSQLGTVSDMILTYNRDIENRVDDTVLMVVNCKARMLRRSRGYVPKPIDTDISLDKILALGAELNNTFALGMESEAILSQHIGDLKSLANYNFYKDALQKAEKLFNFAPEAVACDLHPNYLSAQYALHFGVPIIKVQHHHAHIASVVAEHKMKDEVLGICLDGTGLGTDGHIWGGEFLLCHGKKMERLAHFENIPIQGGDFATHQNWRAGISYLYHYYGAGTMQLDLPLVQDRILENQGIIQALSKNINAPLYSSCGRLFDAVAAILNVCSTQNYQAEAPMLLESLIDPKVNSSYHYAEEDEFISFKPMFDEILEDLKFKVPLSNITTRFHNTLVDAICAKALKLLKAKGINTIALSGGCFQNKYLLKKTESYFNSKSVNCISNYQVPCNDGGISLGQLYVAGHYLSNADNM